MPVWRTHLQPYTHEYAADPVAAAVADLCRCPPHVGRGNSIFYKLSANATSHTLCCALDRESRIDRRAQSGGLLEKASTLQVALSRWRGLQQLTTSFDRQRCRLASPACSEGSEASLTSKLLQWTKQFDFFQALPDQLEFLKARARGK